MLGLLAAFVISTLQDPFTDEVSHFARVGNEDAPAVVIECSPSKYPVWRVHVLPGEYVEAEFMGHANILVRFDGSETQTIVAEYSSESASVEGRKAEWLIDSIADERAAVFGLRGHDGARIDMRVNFEGGRAAVAEIRRLCA